MKTGKVLISWVTAASVGLVLGLLFARGSASRIWRSVRIKRDARGEDIADELKSRVTNFKRQVDKIVADLPVKTHGNKRVPEFQDKPSETVQSAGNRQVSGSFITS